MEESATEKRTSALMMMMPDWTKLPEELLHIILMKLENCFDVVHARSVCSSWRSTIPFSCSLLRQSYSLPTFTEFPNESKGLCTLKKIPFFLFRVCTFATAPAASAFEYFLGGIGRDDSVDHMEISSLIQCSVKVKIRGSEPTLMNMLDCQILPLGHQYRMIGQYYLAVAFVPLNNEDEGEFVVLLNYEGVLLVLKSVEMKWKRLENIPTGVCCDLVTFRGKFYASLFTGITVVIDPYSLDVTLLMPSLHQGLFNHLVPSGSDELYLVEEFNHLVQVVLVVSRLDEEAGKWVEVSDLGDRVLFINHPHLGNVSCSAKELPDGWGLSRNSIFLTTFGGRTNTFKYGVDIERPEDDDKCWRVVRDKKCENPQHISSSGSSTG